MRTLHPELLKAFHGRGFSTPVIGVTGGKGGVGKTTVAVNLASAIAGMGFRVALVDGDVDNPNAGIILAMEVADPEEIYTTIPEIDAARCNACGDCVRACRLHALLLPPGKAAMLVGDCNGCEACLLVCQQQAITRGRKLVGRTYASRDDLLTLFTGELLPGQEESAAVVKAVKKKAFQEAEHFDLVVVDTSPGVHCNVISALEGADLAIAVTEPTRLGAHDLDLILQLLDLFQLAGKIVLNRADLPGSKEEIEAIAGRHGRRVWKEIDTDEALMRSFVEAVPIVRSNPEAPSATVFRDLASEIAKEYLR
ncbi:MAG: P-loop NTPase [Desulfoprunum sp.]|jgi:MinD superfamily P-loop ATPase|uniref:P-loop NTPase n=1 Tax=Desulfoprunum sp. TaxID=2020866 RepID=UPI000A73B372